MCAQTPSAPTALSASSTPTALSASPSHGLRRHHHHPHCTAFTPLPSFPPPGRPKLATPPPPPHRPHHPHRPQRFAYTAPVTPLILTPMCAQTPSTPTALSALPTHFALSPPFLPTLWEPSTSSIIHCAKALCNLTPPPLAAFAPLPLSPPGRPCCPWFGFSCLLAVFRGFQCVPNPPPFVHPHRPRRFAQPHSTSSPPSPSLPAPLTAFTPLPILFPPPGRPKLATPSTPPPPSTSSPQSPSLPPPLTAFTPAIVPIYIMADY